MSEPIRLHVQDHSGARSLDATVSPETSQKDLVRALASRFGYDRTIPCRLFHLQGRALLPEESNLSAIDPGDTLVLVPTGSP